MFKTSLVIPAYNEEKNLEECLLSAMKNSFFEIIVVDNNSSDKTKEIADKITGVKVIQEFKKGPTFARGRGFREAGGDLIAFIDADTRMPKGWIEKVEREFNQNKNLVSLSGPYTYYDIPKWQQFYVKIYWFLAIPVYWITGFMAVGGNLIIKREVLKKMGGLDTSIEFYGDDTDIVRRARKFGEVKFTLSLEMPTSGRRFSEQGFLNTAFTYVLNFFSEVFFSKSFTRGYKDIR